MASGASRFLHAIRSFSESFKRRRGSNIEDYRLLLCGPRDISEILQARFVTKFSAQAASLETLSMGCLQGIAAGWSRLSVSMNDAFVLVFYMDHEDCFQSISSFRETIIEAKGEDVPLLIVGYNRATSAPRIMGPETADCLVTIEWGVGYTEATVGSSADLDKVFHELFRIVQEKHDKIKERERRMTSL